MPCFDPRSSGGDTVYETGISPYKLKEATDRVKWLEAAICSVFSELDKRGIGHSVAREGSRNGLIDLMGFWSQQKDEDERKLAQVLHRYSKHEQAILKKLLEDEE